MTTLGNLKAVQYELVSERNSVGVQLDRVGNLDGPDRWAIRRMRRCLTKSGEWEYEPSPSNRDDAFFERCRFATAEEALAAWDSLTPEQQGVVNERRQS